MQRYLRLPLVQALLCFALFISVVLWRAGEPPTATPPPPHDRVVIAAPVLTLLYGGDRFLAADLEALRLAATGIGNGWADTNYLIRAHKVVAELNPCHEDNLYLANGLLTWGGAVDEGGAILQRATECRHWDHVPPFLYGFNQYFFNRDIETAQQLLELAASRSERDAAALRKLAVMIEVEQIEDEKIALDLLRRERDQARSAQLTAMLDKRVRRLEGLALLREAQRTYEQRTGKPLQEPGELLAAGILDEFPQDPMNWGYEFKDGRFVLRKIKVAGVEER
jgi:hypothetical protein